MHICGHQRWACAEWWRIKRIDKDCEVHRKDGLNGDTPPTLEKSSSSTKVDVEEHARSGWKAVDGQGETGRNLTRKLRKSGQKIARGQGEVGLKVVRRVSGQKIADGYGESRQKVGDGHSESGRKVDV